MSTVFDWRTGDLTPSFAQVAKYYGVQVAVCRRRAANRKGAVEKANDSAAQRFWRTEDVSPEQAQTLLDYGVPGGGMCGSAGLRRSR